MTDAQGSVSEPIEPPEDYEFLEPEEDPGAAVGGGSSKPGAAPSKGGGGANADGRGWGPGWPANNAKNMTTVRAAGIALSVRREIAPLVEWLVNETATRGYGLRNGQCWGFANRPIRGTKRASNHSWGLAVDINSLANPMGRNLVTDMPGWMTELWKSKGFRWGGDYAGRKDAMHFEFTGSPGDAAQRVQGLGAAPSRPQPSTPPPDEPPQPTAPPPEATGPMLRRGAKGDDVRRLQERLRAAGLNCGVDGDFGPGTERAVVSFQGAHGLGADGVVGTRTWAALG